MYKCSLSVYKVSLYFKILKSYPKLYGWGIYIFHYLNILAFVINYIIYNIYNNISS